MIDAFFSQKNEKLLIFADRKTTHHEKKVQYHGQLQSGKELYGSDRQALQVY